MKYGLLWKDGRGTRSVEQQKDWLADEGVGESRMAFECPPGRKGQTVYACFMATFGYNAQGKRRSIRVAIEQFLRYTANGGRLHVLEMDRDYSGIQGFADFLIDWLDHVRKDQTHKARAARKKAPKQEFPAFYLALSTAQRAKFRREFEGNKFNSAADLAHAYGTSRASVYRVAEKLNYTRPRAD